MTPFDLSPDPNRTQFTVFYDGECGLCHAWVRFILKIDPSEDGIKFSPLQNQGGDCDLRSVQLKLDSGEVLDRGEAVRRIFFSVGGFWRLLSWLMYVIPLPILNLGYAFIASIRRRLMPTPKTLCPLVPPHLLKRFI